MSRPLNANIRQLRCSMEVTTAISDLFDNTVPGGTPDVGKAVTMDSDGKVDIATTGEEIFGKLEKLESDGLAVIVDDGFIDFDILAGQTITYGSGLVGGALGTVKTGASATCRAICSAGSGKVRAKMF